MVDGFSILPKNIKKYNFFFFEVQGTTIANRNVTLMALFVLTNEVSNILNLKLIFMGFKTNHCFFTGEGGWFLTLKFLEIFLQTNFWLMLSAYNFKKKK